MSLQARLEWSIQDVELAPMAERSEEYGISFVFLIIFAMIGVNTVWTSIRDFFVSMIGSFCMKSAKTEPSATLAPSGSEPSATFAPSGSTQSEAVSTASITICYRSPTDAYWSDGGTKMHIKKDCGLMSVTDVIHHREICKRCKKP